MSRFARLTLLVLAWFSAGPLRADTTLCVSTANELIAAVTSYRQMEDGATLRIKLVQGNYNIGAALGDEFSNNGEDVKLSLLGGYSAGCTNRVINPLNTVLDGNNQINGSISFVGHGDNARIMIEGLTFKRIRGNNSDFHGALTLLVSSSDDGIATVRYCRFVQNNSRATVLLAAPQMRLVNNRITDNIVFPVASFPAAAVDATYAHDFEDSSLYAGSNTIANNLGGTGLYLVGGPSGSSRLSEVVNNIIWGNGFPQIQMQEFDHAENFLLLSGNIYSSIVNPAPTASGNLNSNPLFVSAEEGVYTLQLTSPGINSGVPVQFNSTPTQELLGGPRIVGSVVDRGAYESDVDNTTNFLVTTFGDNGSNANPTAGSLRAAIKAANNAGGPYLIRFAIPGSCPRAIVLAAPMLDIVGDVTIDGRTQPGWSANSDYGQFDATLCLFINGTGSTPYAFRVPASAVNARLSVHGFIFAGFSDAAIRIERGANHRISGNQFGAVVLTASNHDAVRITGNAGSAFIGGYDDPGSVNLIAGTADAGVYLDNAAGGSTVVNNVIGFQPDGIFAGTNPVGIFVFNSPNNQLAYNYVGNSSSNGITLSGAASIGNTLNYNVVGSNRMGGSAANAGAGVGVIFGARYNTIGAMLTGAFGGNDIRNNVGPGVWISPSGGIGNRVLANSMSSNGDVDIDLNAAGASANQPSNPQSGPNQLQNYPVLTQALRSAATGFQLVVTGQLQSAPLSTYRVDVYYSATCGLGTPPRGVPNYHFGFATVTTNPAGAADFSITLGPPSVALPPGRISATATSASGDTSEIGNCVVEGASLPDLMFSNGFE